MNEKKITSALVSVYNKEGIDVLISALKAHDVTIYSTGGTYKAIRSMGVDAILVEELTGFPAMLDGRVKTLHPAVFAGILARRDEDHLGQLATYNLPQIDMVVVDLYPFEETLKQTDDENLIIDKIDIGGVSLLRAGAKNSAYVAVISAHDQYQYVADLLESQQGMLLLAQRKLLAFRSFEVTAAYERAIADYFAGQSGSAIALRYGENPHQKALYIGNLNTYFHQLGGKELSYNNLVDIDAALHAIYEFRNSGPTYVIIKHTNPCGIATRKSGCEAWKATLACDPSSAFGGVIITNREIDMETATLIDSIFYEVLIAPGFEAGVVEILKKKKNRILLESSKSHLNPVSKRQMFDGTLIQDVDLMPASEETLTTVTTEPLKDPQKEDVLYAIGCVKHLKSNAIAIVKDRQLIGSGAGQTSRVDALFQAIRKAGELGFDLEGSVLASDAFFPFADSVEMADRAGIKTIVQPGGSVQDQSSVDYCNSHGMVMVFTGIRHFKH